MFPRPILAREWERVIERVARERDFARLYVAAMMCAKECRYRAEDWGGEAWFYWTTGELSAK